MDSVLSCDLQSLLLLPTFPTVLAMLARTSWGKKHSPVQDFSILNIILPSGAYRGKPLPEPAEHRIRQTLGNAKISMAMLPPDSLVVPQRQGSADERGRCQRRGGAERSRTPVDRLPKSGDSFPCGESQNPPMGALGEPPRAAGKRPR